MSSKNAIIYAAWFPNLERSTFYINDLKKNMPNEDVYFGINQSNTQYHTTLNLIGYDNVALTPPERTVNSDASAFQTALELYKNSNVEHEILYFIHTKAASYKDDNAWWSSYDSYYLGFFRQMQKIKEAFASDSNIGGVSYVGRKEPMNGSGYSTALDKYYKFDEKNKVEDIMSLITMYAIKGNIVKEFVQNADPSFFTDKLERYFFETSFPLIVDRMGSKRKHLEMW